MLAFQFWDQNQRTSRPKTSQMNLHTHIYALLLQLQTDDMLNRELKSK